MTDTVKAPSSTRFVRYYDRLENPRPDEGELIKKMADALFGNNKWALKKYGRGIRDAHAKGLAFLHGSLEVYDGLDQEYRQGLFAEPKKKYDIIARLSSTAGAIRTDQARGIRGLGIKVIRVDGDRALPDDTRKNHDFVLVTHREFPFKDAQAYLKRGMRLARLLVHLPDPALILAGDVLSRIQPILRVFGQSLPASLLLFTEPNVHILGMTFFSSAPFRYGDYVAKWCVAPLSKSVTQFEGQLVPSDAGPDAFRDMVASFFRTNSAGYEFRVQLLTDPIKMPIEDATVEWPEKDSPYVGVAKITFPDQNTYSAKRRAFADDELEFNPWHGLAAHRPLGSINRLKRLVYEASTDFRHRANRLARREPESIQDLPE
jgi:hypothetical protein